MAAPHISGVIALMMSYKPNATPTEILEALKETAENPETSDRNDGYGHGIVNSVTAIERLADTDGGGGSQPTPAPECNGENLEFELTFNTDAWGLENTWELTDEQTGSVEGSGGPYDNNESYVTRYCLLSSQCYKLTIFDSYGDGYVFLEQND
jgi:serine protease